jgi:hypothetical protein
MQAQVNNAIHVIVIAASNRVEVSTKDAMGYMVGIPSDQFDSYRGESRTC